MGHSFVTLAHWHIFTLAHWHIPLSHWHIFTFLCLVHISAFPLSPMCRWRFCHFWIGGGVRFFSWHPEFGAFGIEVHIWGWGEWSAPIFRCFGGEGNERFLTSAFRKPTFTGQYFCWNSFGSTNRKTNLIETLVHRVLMICSKGGLQHGQGASAPFCGLMDTRRALFKSPCLRKLRFSAVRQRGDRRGVRFAWGFLGLAKFLWILRSKPGLLTADVAGLLNLALFLLREKFGLQFIKRFYPSFNKVWSYINTCAAVTIGTRSNFPKIAGQN